MAFVYSMHVLCIFFELKITKTLCKPNRDIADITVYFFNLVKAINDTQTL